MVVADKVVIRVVMVAVVAVEEVVLLVVEEVDRVKMDPMVAVVEMVD